MCLIQNIPYLFGFYQSKDMVDGKEEFTRYYVFPTYRLASIQTGDETEENEQALYPMVTALSSGNSLQLAEMSVGINFSQKLYTPTGEELMVVCK